MFRFVKGSEFTPDKDHCAGGDLTRDTPGRTSIRIRKGALNHVHRSLGNMSEQRRYYLLGLANHLGPIVPYFVDSVQG